MGNYAKYTVGSFSFHQVKVEEIENGLKITETFDTDIVERVISINSFPFIRTTNEDGFDTYQILDNVGEIYNLPAKADEFILIDINGSTFLPSDGVELIEDSLQLAPFRKAGAVNEVVALGEITATTTSINLAVHSSGSNKVKLNGSLYIKSTQNNWTFPEITEDSTFLIYALPDSEIFHLTDTEVPNGGYLVRTVNISASGGIIVEDKEYIPTASDAWRNVPLTTNPQWVQITAPFASTLNLIPNAAGREFAGVNTKFRKNGWDGKNIFLRNDSEFELVLKPTTTTAANTTFYTFEEEQVLKAHAWKLFKIREVGGDFFLVEVVLGKDINPDLFMLIADYVQDGKIRADKIESLALLDLIISVQTSIADFAANSGGYTFQKNDLIAVPDGSGKYSFYIYAGGVKTDVASYLAMGISNVTISQVVGLQDTLNDLQSQITNEKNRNDTQDGQITANANAISSETTARIAADKIETVVITLSPYNEDLTDNISRLGFGVLTFPLKVLSFQTSAYPVPTGSGITTQLRKNGTAVTTTHSVIPAGLNNSSTSPTPVFADNTFAVGDRLNFFTPTGGVGSTVKGQNLMATLIIERL